MPSSLLVMTVADEGVPCVQSTAGEPQVHETFIVLHEIGNEHDRYAMAVYQDEEPGIVTATFGKPAVCRKCALIKRLTIEIKLNSFAEIILFKFVTGVPKIRGAEIIEGIL